MTNSLILRAPGVASIPNRPKLTLDPMIRAGTKLLYDFSRPQCHPNGVITAGAMNSKTVLDISGNDVPLVFPSAGWSANSDGSISNTQSVSGCTIGSVGQFDMSVSEYEYVATYWFGMTTGYLVTNAAPMLTLTASGTGSAQIYLTIGGDGRKATAYVMGESAGAIISPEFSLDEPHMAAVHFSPGGTFGFYFDGAPIWVSPTAVSELTAATAFSLLLSGGPNRKTHRISLCDLTASRAAEEAMGYNDNAILTGAQHILREWQFCTNQIAAAPKTAFGA